MMSHELSRIFFYFFFVSSIYWSVVLFAASTNSFLFYFCSNTHTMSKGGMSDAIRSCVCVCGKKR